MSFISSNKKLYKLESPLGYCFPLALDAIMPHDELPERYYHLFKESRESGTSFNDVIVKLIREYFGIEPQIDEASHYCVAEFDAYGASPQLYFTDGPYDYTDRINEFKKEYKIQAKHLRMQDILERAAQNGCNILFYDGDVKDDHVSGLQLVDHIHDMVSAQFIVRDYGGVRPGKVFSTYDLSGISTYMGEPSDEYSPLPEYAEDWYPDGASSSKLIILPPEPSSL